MSLCHPRLGLAHLESTIDLMIANLGPAPPRAHTTQENP